MLTKKIIACLGEKLGMTQLLVKRGSAVRAIPVPVTAIWVDLNIVSQLKTVAGEGYSAFQLSFKEPTKRSALNKPALGHFEKKNLLPRLHLAEIRTSEESPSVSLGETIDLALFQIGKRVKITANSKGKGFAGVIKKYHFHRGRMSHGAGYPHRQIGSLCFGRGSGQKVIKGKKMPGRMGNKKTTRLTVIEKVESEKRIIYLRGAVPGPKKGLVLIKQLV